MTKWMVISCALGALLTTGLPATADAGGGTISGTVTARRARTVRNTVVWLEGVPGAQRPPAAPVSMDQVNQKFRPRVLPIVKGTTVRFLNNDNTGHNVYTPDGEAYDLGTWPKGEHRDHTFTAAGTYTQLCKMHPQMIAYIVVVPTTFFARTGRDGTFQLTNVPPGTYTLKVWNERKRADSVQVTVTAGGTATVEIPLR